MDNLQLMDLDISGFFFYHHGDDLLLATVGVGMLNAAIDESKMGVKDGATLCFKRCVFFRLGFT